MRVYDSKKKYKYFPELLLFLKVLIIFSVTSREVPNQFKEMVFVL